MSRRGKIRIDLPALSRGLVDRSEDIREPSRIAAGWSTAKLLRVDPAGGLPLRSEGGETRLALDDAADLGSAPPAGAVLLGSIAGIYFWAAPAALPAPQQADDAGAAPSRPGAAEAVPSPSPSPSPSSAPSPSPTPLVRSTIRSAGPLLADDEAALATTAVALLGWHAGAGFCSRCGRPTTPDVAGHSRTCPVGHQEFPRTDPAVIVLVHDGAGNAVLARQPTWAAGRFSVLAGFAEAGESLEATVRREIGEEVGIPVEKVRYLGSQPWPFPRSLMIAFAARAPRGAVLRPRPGEIEQARWFSRERLRAMLAGEADESGVTLPDSVSIARRMVEGFVRAG